MANRTIPGAGGPIPIRIYTPEGQGPFPVVVYYHGGGWVIADLDTYDASPAGDRQPRQRGRRVLALPPGAGAQVPGRAPGCLRGVPVGAGECHDRSRATPSKVAVVGESAGGNLAAAVSMMARDSGAQLPVYQVLVYPDRGNDMNTPSYQENADAKPLNKPMMQWFFKQYLRTPADGQNPLIDLVHADLDGLPAATVITAQIDPLRSEGKELADRLKDAGVRGGLQELRGRGPRVLRHGRGGRRRQAGAAAGCRAGLKRKWRGEDGHHAA